MENDQATVLCDLQIITHRHKHCNKPDLVIKETETVRSLVIDVAIPSDFNIKKKTTEKMSKCIDPQLECEGKCSKKVEVIPVFNGTTGIVEKNWKNT